VELEIFSYDVNLVPILHMTHVIQESGTEFVANGNRFPHIHLVEVWCCSIVTENEHIILRANADNECVRLNNKLSFGSVILYEIDNSLIVLCEVNLM